ncbi:MULTISPECIES: outer membrane lipoprotein chaperone LolA [unclassified Luteimonas]|uniref:outer membrane lipoprotein chaperone LolA n=1 Tax=unclassified Luteimonas TaxID=2629088 RepID=UPI0018F05F34|nr:MULTISPECIES: outer membrane lipoprotein chaperone LolA [unclassified Luteimonas]MBJ6977840.1 outer membrane lipoprotein chaperone LolA [Luteimonas sp. MC1895]MBJ6984659.1 outer membrane lipoprotein chaperone LolA [Luteimonas sp. MC1750]QQO04739.1 outer membrane lipoprotein chaperone LolA [Luteimonas sp. MC1750]
MIRMRNWLAALALLSTVAGTAFAGPRDDLAAFSDGLKGLDGRFEQKLYDLDGRLKETSRGRVALSAPRLFRWEYATPYEQLIVADGKKVWVFDPDLEQVTVRPQGPEEQNSPLAALVDPAKLERDFNVREGGESEGLSWLLLSPKDAQQASFSSARLGFRGPSLARMEVVDTLGQRTEVVFSGWKRNPVFERSTFRFVPPAGVDVVGEG